MVTPSQAQGDEAYCRDRALESGEQNVNDWEETEAQAEYDYYLSSRGGDNEQ